MQTNDKVVMFRGTVYESGYGLIARKVMRDKKLKPQAKAIYAYLCSFAGNNEDNERSAFPSVSLMKDELGIKSQDTFYKYMNQLKEAGYISIEKQRDEGKFERNIYYIEAVQKSLTQQPQEVKPRSKKSTTKKRTTKNSTTKNRNSNNNSSINNSLNNNSFNNHHPVIEHFNQLQSNMIHEFIQKQKLDDDEVNKLTVRLKGKNFKHPAYIEKAYQTMKNAIQPDKPIRTEYIPDHMQDDFEQPKNGDPEIDAKRAALKAKLDKLKGD